MTLWLLCLASLVRANTPLLLPDTSFDQSVSRYISLLEDADNQLDIDQITDRRYQQHFTPSHSDNIRLGITHSTWWFRISISNPYPDNRQVVLTLSNSHLRDTRLYSLGEGAAAAAIDADNGFPAPSGGYQQAHPFMLDIRARHTETFLLRVQGKGLLNADVRLMSPDRFLQREQWHSTLLGMVEGWLLATAAWFIHLAISRRSILSIWAATHCLAATLFTSAWMGQTSLLLGLSPEASEALYELSAGIAIAAQIMAIRLLGWRGAITDTIRQGLVLLALLTLMIAAILAGNQGGLSEVLMPAAVVIIELVLALILVFGDTRQVLAQRWLLAGALGAVATILLVVLASYNLLVIDALQVWTAMLLPVLLAISLVLAAFHLSRQADDRSLEPRNTGIQIPPRVLSQISHELRTPINGIIGIIELLNDSPLTETQKENTDTIDMACTEMLYIANAISDLARIQHDHLELDSRPFDIMQLVSNTLAPFQTEALRKHIELVVDHDEHLSARFIGDGVRLQNLLHSLFARLLAYLELGELNVHIRPINSAGKSADEGITIQILLNGTITNRDDLRAHLEQLKSQEPIESNWSQLVLQQLLRFMKVSLEIESLTPQGGSLTLYMPTLRDASDTLGNQAFDDSLIGMHLLLVDDNASLRKVLEKQIRRWGIRVDSTHSGKEALAMLRNQCALGQPYDGAIIDQDMPVMSGIELARRLRDDDKIHIKPSLLMLTGLSVNHVREQAEKVGIRHLLTKPASGERLKLALMGLRYRPDRPSRQD